MKRRFIFIIAAALLAVLFVFGGTTSATQPLPTTMEHDWLLDIGDTLWFDGTEFIVWKRMEALHPQDMETYYYYQIAPKGVMEGQWIWEGEIGSLEDGGTRGGGEPEPPLCPPYGTPPPC